MNPAEDFPQPEATPDVTGLLAAWRRGDQDALAALTPIVHRELRRVAASCLRRERSDHTLQPTALIN